MSIDPTKLVSSRYIPNDAETYEAWFKRQVQEGLREADDPNTVWVSNEEVFKQIDENLRQRHERTTHKKAS